MPARPAEFNEIRALTPKQAKQFRDGQTVGRDLGAAMPTERDHVVCRRSLKVCTSLVVTAVVALGGSRLGCRRQTTVK